MMADTCRQRGAANEDRGQLEVITRPISGLTLDPKNPREHRPKQIRQIAKSITAFGFNVPVLIDAQHRVIAGHGRILACKQLGWTDVPTICLLHLTEDQRRAFVIADNRLTEQSKWDERLLGEQLKELAEVNLDFHLEATGFDMGEIDLLIEGALPVAEEANDPADATPAPAVGPPVTQPGDVWLLGPHRVCCGNALENEAYQMLMGQRHAALVFIDAPYNVPIAGHASGLGRITHREFVMASGELSEAEFTAFLSQMLTLTSRYSAEGTLLYSCMDWRHLRELLDAGRAAALTLKHFCVWDEESGGMGSLYRSQHELVLVFKKGSAPHRNNVQLGQYGRSRTNIWKYPGAQSFARPMDEGNLLALHPTVKPVALVADLMLDASGRGDVVLDPFLGSGTTVIAAERTGRLCYGLELDPHYVDVAIRRWQTFTGQMARLASTGQRFDERASKLGGSHGG